MGTLEAHSGVGVYLASFCVPKLELSYFQQGHSVLRCTLRCYFTLILQSIMGTLEAHSGGGVYLASFVVPKLELSYVQQEHSVLRCTLRCYFTLILQSIMGRVRDFQ